MTEAIERETGVLLELARLYGVQTSFVDAWGEERVVSVETLAAILRALGAPMERMEEAEDALRFRRRELAGRPIEPAAVAWEGEEASLEIRLPYGEARDGWIYRVLLESGETLSGEGRLEDLPVEGTAESDGRSWDVLNLALPRGIPHGYHRLVLETGGNLLETHLLSAPARGWEKPLRRDDWGVFLPLYALHSRRSWGAGHLGDLSDLVEWTAEAGGRMVLTLPLLACFLDELYEPSPYVPVSRLFWNEFYLDLEAAPELAACEEAKELIDSAGFRSERDRLRAGDVVEYRRGAALRRQVLERLAEAFFAGGSASREAFERLLSEDARLEDYARFRAACEGRREPWWEWPDRMRDGDLEEGDGPEGSFRYHLFAQYLLHGQLASLDERARERNLALCLDFPLGVNRAGYDVWRHRDAFALQVGGGAPPDDFFPTGQNWGFPPLHPQRSRAEGHAYWAACVRNLMRHAGMLRVDHVMGLHRLYWVPEGMTPAQGSYVAYPWEELYAVLAIESNRAGCVLMGEDLGTVPPEVPVAMKRFGVRRTHVFQFGLGPDPDEPIEPVAPGSISSLNTHDMFPFAAFWHGEDTVWRREAGLLDPDRANEMHRWREELKGRLVRCLVAAGLLQEGEEREEEVAAACLVWLGGCPAETVLVNLEDLWAETRPQNIPGTGPERENWRGKARYALEELRASNGVVRALARLDLARRQEREGS